MTEKSNAGSGEDPTQTGEFGPMPTPQIEPGEPAPGGPDSVSQPEEIVAADLDPDKNPATEESPEQVKDTLKEGEDTDTAATRSDGSDDAAGEDDGDAAGTGEEESPA